MAYRSPKDYAGIVKALGDYHSNQLAFAGPSISVAEDPLARLLVRPDSRTENIENKADAWVEDLSWLTLLLKNRKGDLGQGPSSGPQKNNRVRTFSYCNELGHTDSRCERNQHSKTLCTYCGRIGNSLSTCFSAPLDKSEDKLMDTERKKEGEQAVKVNVLRENWVKQSH